MAEQRQVERVLLDHMGDWWDAKTPRKKWHGRLLFDDAEGTRLLVSVRSPRWDHADREYEVILGETNDGKRFSLLNCFDTLTSVSSRSRLARREIYAQLVLDGIHVRSTDPILYGATATFRYGGVWWGTNHLRTKHGKKGLRRVTIRYSAPEPLILFKDGSVELTAYATLASLPSSTDDGGEFTVNEEVRFELLSKEGRPLSYFVDTLQSCRDLLSIACQDYCDMLRLEVYQDRKHLVEARYHGVPLFRSSAKRRHHTLLFGLRDIKRQRRNVFSSWFANADETAAMRALYCVANYGEHFVEGKFLALCQVVEGFHGRFRKGEFMPKGEYKERVAQLLVDAIPQDLDPLLRASLMERIKYGYQFSLQKRLRLLFEEFADALDVVVPNAAQYIQPIVRQRNYLTHDPLVGGLEDRPLSREYLKYNFLLKMLAELCFLSAMGIPKKQVAEFFKRSYTHQAYARRFFK
jgi:hypothetical protein